MINKKDFTDIRKQMEAFEAKREELINKSRIIQKSSKLAIYSVHRGDMKDAEKLLNEVEKDISYIKHSISTMPKLDFLGSYTASIQEYCEAKCYYCYVTEKRIPSWKELSVDVEDYLSGLSDLTGELTRRAVVCVINNNNREVHTIKVLIEEIYGLFLQLNLRNSELRKKSDSIKWNLKKIEDIIYDIKTRGKIDEENS